MRDLARHVDTRDCRGAAVNRPAPTLFDASRTQPTSCQAPGCGAIRLPDQQRCATCAHDLDPEQRKRPRACLNATDPAHQEIPF